jgi:hypothetical protein
MIPLVTSTTISIPRADADAPAEVALVTLRISSQRRHRFTGSFYLRR